MEEDCYVELVAVGGEVRPLRIALISSNRQNNRQRHMHRSPLPEGVVTEEEEEEEEQEEDEPPLWRKIRRKNKKRRQLKKIAETKRKKPKKKKIIKKPKKTPALLRATPTFRKDRFLL